MRRLVIAAAVAAVAACNRALPPDRSIEHTYPTTAPAAPRGDLRVVTFNVHRETTENVIRGISKDPALADADIFILQEVHRVEMSNRPDPRGELVQKCSPACTLGKTLGYYAIYAPGHMQGDGSDGVAIVSRIPITSAEVLELPYFNVKFNSGRRVALAATIHLNSEPVTVYAVHLDNRIGVADRKTQMLPVLEHAAKQTSPVIIAGDFNTSPMTWIGGVIPIPTGTQDNHFERLVRSHGFATPVKDSGRTHRYFWMKLDGIYTRGFDTLDFATAKAQEVSDHLALWATLRKRT
jgi:endonuclease/exonuclease/phosphatase family metal-dependent hydrolase